MKDYKRLTFDCWKYDEFLKQDEKYARLAELEDKIESGELCDREEVRKETARDILKPLYDAIMEYPDYCVNLSEDIKSLMKEYGIEQVGNSDKLKDEE